MNYDWNFARLIPYYKAFLSGTVTTISLTLVVLIFGTILGIIIGLIMSNKIIKKLLYPMIDIIRALPPLVLILFMYYLLTRQIIGMTIQAFWVCAVAMTLNLAAFTSDLVRAAIENVPKDSIDAGQSVGMTHKQLIRYIKLPHVVREIIPAMTILYIGMLKMSSLASIISVREIVYTAQTVIANITRSLEAWTVVAVIYIILVIPSTYFARRVENWVRRGKFTSK